MRWLLVVRVAALLVPLTWAGGTWGADAPQASPAKPRTGIIVWDTGRPAAEALAPAALAGKNDWTRHSRRGRRPTPSRATPC